MINPTARDVNKSVQLKRLAIIGITDLAAFIEQVLQAWLPPYPQGIYLPNQLEPVLTPGNNYFFEAVLPNEPGNEWLVNRASYHYGYIPVGDLVNVIGSPWDVVDAAKDGKVVMSRRDTKAATPAPTKPLRGAKIAYDIICNYVYSKLAYAKIGELKIEEIIESHLHEQAQAVHDIINNPLLERISHDIFDQFLDTFQRIKSFMGDNYFLMHELSYANPMELHLEQKGDFRVYDWTRRMVDGTWK